MLSVAVDGTQERPVSEKKKRQGKERHPLFLAMYLLLIRRRFAIVVQLPPVPAGVLTAEKMSRGFVMENCLHQKTGPHRPKKVWKRTGIFVDAK